jgi:hypothetical protein
VCSDENVTDLFCIKNTVRNLATASGKEKDPGLSYGQFPLLYQLLKLSAPIIQVAKMLPFALHVECLPGIRSVSLN